MKSSFPLLYWLFTTHPFARIPIQVSVVKCAACKETMRPEPAKVLSSHDISRVAVPILYCLIPACFQQRLQTVMFYRRTSPSSLIPEAGGDATSLPSGSSRLAHQRPSLSVKLRCTQAWYLFCQHHLRHHHLQCSNHIHVNGGRMSVCHHDLSVRGTQAFGRGTLGNKQCS